MSVSFAARIASFQFCVHRALGRGDHARAHLHALGAQGEGRGHGAAVDDAAGGDHRHADLRADQRQQHHRRHLARVLEAAALAALDDQAVDAGVDRLQRRRQRRHDVEHGQARVLQRAAVAVADRRPRW